MVAGFRLSEVLPDVRMPPDSNMCVQRAPCLVYAGLRRFTLGLRQPDKSLCQSPKSTGYHS